MIQETTTYTCHSCGSVNIIRNGRNKCGNPQYHCKDCGVYRVFKVSRQMVAGWIRDYVFELPLLVDTLLPAQEDDVLALDEPSSFVLKKSQKR